MGWLDPANPGNTPQTLTLHPNGTTQYTAYQINESGTKQAYNREGVNYYIENRQKIGWDRCLPAAGMLIWKVNYKKSIWKENAPNASSTSGAPLYTIMTPSGSTKIAGSSSDVFKSGSWNKLSGKPLTNIKVSNQIVTLNYIGEGSAIERVQELANPTDEPRKIIRNGQILILKDGKLYNLTGNIVE